MDGVFGKKTFQKPLISSIFFVGQKMVDDSA